jgi:hypothetical protein
VGARHCFNPYDPPEVFDQMEDQYPVMMVEAEWEEAEDMEGDSWARDQEEEEEEGRHIVPMKHLIPDVINKCLYDPEVLSPVRNWFLFLPPR